MVENQNNLISNEEKLLDLPKQLTAGDLSEIMEISPAEVIKELMRHGVMANINEMLNVLPPTLREHLLLEFSNKKVLVVRHTRRRSRKGGIESKLAHWSLSFFL